MADLGNLALWITLVIGVWGTLAAFAGGLQGRDDLAASGERAVYVQFGLLVVASLGLIRALVTHDFNIEYVASYTSRNLPGYYIVSAFWAGQKGSLLFWAVMLSGFAALAQWLTPARYRTLMPYVGAVTSGVVVFFVIVMLSLW